MLNFFISTVVYKAVKGLLEFISRNWIMILVFILLAVFLGVAWGSFFIAAYVLLEHKHNSTLFNPKIFISFGLWLFNFYALTTEFYKEFPVIYKGAVLFNLSGLFLSILYLSKFIKTGQLQISAFALFCAISIFGVLPSLYIYNSVFHISKYALSERKDFHRLIMQEKREKYKPSFDTFVNSHHKIKVSDFPIFSIECEQIYNSSISDKPDVAYKTDELIMVEIGSIIRDTRYTYETDGNIEILFYSSSMNGFDATYYNNKIYYNKHIEDEFGYYRIEGAMERGQRIYTEISFEVKVLPVNINDYIRYVEGKPVKKYRDKVMISEEYLKAHKIPVTPAKMASVQKAGSLS